MASILSRPQWVNLCYLFSMLHRGSKPSPIRCCQRLSDCGPALTHYSDAIMSEMTSQITGASIDCSTFFQSSASLAFVRDSTGDRWIPLKRRQWRGKWFHLMTSSYDLASIHGCMWSKSCPFRRVLSWPCITTTIWHNAAFNASSSTSWKVYRDAYRSEQRIDVDLKVSDIYVDLWVCGIWAIINRYDTEPVVVDKSGCGTIRVSE